VTWRLAGSEPRQRFVLLDEEAGRAAQLVRDLGAWVVMANHVHIVILPGIPLRKIMQKLKGGTTLAANRLPGRTGTFRNGESCDHFIIQ
jgi:hypothetical protein